MINFDELWMVLNYWVNSLSDEQKQKLMQGLMEASERPPVKIKARDLPSRKSKDQEQEVECWDDFETIDEARNENLRLIIRSELQRREIEELRELVEAGKEDRQAIDELVDENLRLRKELEVCQEKRQKLSAHQVPRTDRCK